MVWARDEARGNKSNKGGYENERRREMTKKEMVRYD